MNYLKLTSLALATTAAIVPSAAEAAPKKPNVIIIFTDDQGYQDLGCFGSPDIKTPRIDQMAKEGLLLTQFYVSAPTSSPSRASLLTGKLNTHNGVLRVLSPTATGMPTSEVTIAEMLREAGYNTACYGKWHIGSDEGQMAIEQGFDEYFGIPYSNNMSLAPSQVFAKDCNFREGYTRESAMQMQKIETFKQPKEKAPLIEGREIVEFPCDQATTTRRYFDRAIEFINKSGKKPFFTYITPAMPHRPYFASEQFLGTSERGIYGDVVEDIDWNVGRLLDHLKAKKLDKNTIIIFTSDNGPSVAKKNMKDGGCALPLRGQKFLTYEGGVRVPFIMRWSGVIPAGEVSDEMTASIDLLPSLATMTGAKLPDSDVDGLDMSKFFTDPCEANAIRDTYHYIAYGLHMGVRVGDWKYLPVGGENYRGKTPTKGTAMLFNLATDPYEKKNLRNTPEAEAIIAKLRKASPDLIDELPASATTQKGKRK